RGRSGVVAGEHDRPEAKVVQLVQNLGRFGPRLVCQANPAQWSSLRGDRDCRADRVLGLAQLVVKGWMTEPGLVDVAVAAEVILDRVDAAQRALAGDRTVIVRDRHIQAQAAGMAGNGLAQDMS